jgi:DNA polymerase delta subunit 1
VPALLDDLAKFRKHAKKLVAQAKKSGDDFKENLYDAVSYIDIGFGIAIR